MIFTFGRIHTDHWNLEKSIMFRQASTRNNRNKGFKVKHVLQMCLLLAICIWLLYQVKHSHDKKKAFDANNAKIAERVDGGNQILKLGRKDLNHGVEVTSENEKHDEEEESEEDESKLDESIDKERGDGDDEIDEHDQEKVDEAAERGEEFSDEDKEAREEENEEKEEKKGESEDMGSSENHDHDVEDRNTQEAREENYKGDDASSAVVKDNQMIKTEVDNEGLRNSVEEHVNDGEKNNSENDLKTNTTEDGTTVDQNNSKPNAGELPIATGDGETTVNNPSVHATNFDKGVEISTLKSENESLSNLPTTESVDQTAWHNNATGDASETPGLYLKNETTTLGTVQDQNATVEAGASDRENFNSESVALEHSERSNATTVMEETQTIVLEQIEKSNATTGSEESPNVVADQTIVTEQSEKSITNVVVEQTQATILEQTEKSNETAVGEESQNAVPEQTAVSEESQKVEFENNDKSNTTTQVEESDDSMASPLTTSENADVAQIEASDASSSLVTQEEKDAITDLGTLPHIESEGRNTEDLAAE